MSWIYKLNKCIFALQKGIYLFYLIYFLKTSNKKCLEQSYISIINILVYSSFCKYFKLDFTFIYCFHYNFS